MANDQERWDGDSTMRVRPEPGRDAADVSRTDWSDPPVIHGDPVLPDAEPLTDSTSRTETWDADPTVVAGSNPVQTLITGSTIDVEGSFEPESDNATRTRSVDQQMFVLLGGQQFAQREPSLVARTRLRSIHDERSTSPWRYVIATVFVLLGAFIVFVVAFGLNERSKQTVNELSEQLEGVTSGGALGDAESLVQKLKGLDKQTPDQARLVARTEALLFRFRDGNGERLEHVNGQLPRFAPNDPDGALVVNAIVAAVADRITVLPELKRIAEKTEDAEVHFLMASALSRAGSDQAAAKSFEQSLDIEPSNLEHLTAYAEHRIDTNRLNAAENLLAIMREVSPTSPWTRYIAARLNHAQRTERHTIEPAADEVEIVVPVADAFSDLASAIVAYEEEQSAALDGVRAAIQAVENQPAFLVDFMDRLLAASWTEAARVVANEGKVTPATPGAAAALARLRLAEGDAAGAVVDLARIVKNGYRDPVTNLAYFEALEAVGAPSAERQRARDALQQAWPDRPDLAVSSDAGSRKPKSPKRTKRRRRRRKRRR